MNLYKDIIIDAVYKETKRRRPNRASVKLPISEHAFELINTFSETEINFTELLDAVKMLKKQNHFDFNAIAKNNIIRRAIITKQIINIIFDKGYEIAENNIRIDNHNNLLIFNMTKPCAKTLYNFFNEYAFYEDNNEQALIYLNVEQDNFKINLTSIIQMINEFKNQRYSTNIFNERRPAGRNITKEEFLQNVYSVDISFVEHHLIDREVFTNTINEEDLLYIVEDHEDKSFLVLPKKESSVLKIYICKSDTDILNILNTTRKTNRQIENLKHNDKFFTSPIYTVNNKTYILLKMKNGKRVSIDEKTIREFVSILLQDFEKLNEDLSLF